MKKILLISYFYPPVNFVGGDRTASWAKCLHERGYYPIVITRQWNEGQTDLVDKLENNLLKVEYNNTHEIHRLPYKRSLRDRCAAYKWLKPVQKALTLVELIASNFFIRALPYSNFYFYCKQLIQHQPNITMVIASGRPFQSFFIGHRLKKDFPHMHWIPDYRDEWTSKESGDKERTIHSFLWRLDKKSELKWTSNSSSFITTSHLIQQSIQNHINKSGSVVLNGFDAQQHEVPSNQIKGELNIIYSGTLYSYQNIETLIDAVKFLLKNTTFHLQVHYIGVTMLPDELHRLQHEIGEFHLNFKTYPRVPKNELVEFYSKADILYLTSYEENKGWLPVKLFEYFSLSRPILLCPSDHDVMEQFIHETGSGFIANSVEECVEVLTHLIRVKQCEEALNLTRNEAAGAQYSRQHQAKILAHVLDQLD